ncbi:MAG: terpene cyclase/mutase family protein [Rhodobacterales bacterium]|nr:terpene cyclase/mutase family protein [Rhodobacterales bacterium]
MIKALRTLLVAGLLALPSVAMADDQPMDPALREQAKRAVDDGLHFLRQTMKEDGSWANSVGVTALALRAFLTAHRGYAESDGAFITQPVQFLLYNVRKDGAISESVKNGNYNTATAIFALRATGNPAYGETIDNASKYLRGLQIDEDDGYEPDHKYYGGVGYGGDERPDLSNMYYALEALRAAGVAADDPVWKKALSFVSRSQNRSESNDQPWAANDGGFTYMPGYSPHGGTGSYGAMTAAGLISLIYAGVDRNDPRIQAAWSWMLDHYTLDDNPGAKKKQGLFYYYAAFAKVMSAMGETTVTDSKGATHNWRNELATKLLSMQDKTDGSWINPYSSRWWEGIKPLTTARAVIALNLAIQ